MNGVLLPPLHPALRIRRWTPGRKAAICVAVLDGDMTVGEVSRRYQLSMGMITRWIDLYRRLGFAGLRTSLQEVSADASDR